MAEQSASFTLTVEDIEKIEEMLTKLADLLSENRLITEEEYKIFRMARYMAFHAWLRRVTGKYAKYTIPDVDLVNKLYDSLFERG